MSLLPEIEALARAKKFDDIENRWMARQDAAPSDSDFFFSAAQALKNAGEKKRMVTLLGMLADSRSAAGDWLGRLAVLEETVRLSSGSIPLPELRKQMRECLVNAYPGSKSIDGLLGKFGFEATTSPQAAADAVSKARKWILWDVGTYVYMVDAGAGRVVDLNLALGNVRVDFEKKKGASIPVGAAPKHLVILPPGHLLREWLDAPDPIRAQVDEEPATIFRRLSESFGRPLTQTEIKGALSTIVPEGKWTRFWGVVQKHPQVIHLGKGKATTFDWSDSVDAAADSVRAEFDASPLPRQLELARKHAKRDAALAAHFASSLAAAAEEARDKDPSVALEILLTLEKVPAPSGLSWDAVALVADVDPRILLARLGDRSLREKALLLLREARPEEWTTIYRDAFMKEDDPRTLNKLAETLSAEAPESWQTLVDDILRQPRRHPARFLWFCERIQGGITSTAADAGVLPPRVDQSLLGQLFQALEWDDFAPLRPRLRALFDRGGLSLRIVQAFANEEQGRQLVEQLPKVHGIEGFRKAILEEAVFRKFPALRQSSGPEVLFATPEAAEAKRRELEHMLKVELPANGQAMKEAVALGDLSENFEYKSARQKHEYLTARIAKLQEELGRVRIIEADKVDSSEVRIGTRLWLRDGDAERVVTLLGPWESKPEDSVYSYQSELGASLLGKKAGDEVRIGEAAFRIDRITPWNVER